MSARGEVRAIETSRVALDGGTQSREELIHEDTLRDYIDAMERGEELPPIDVVDDGTHAYLVDGFHRHAAHLRLRRATIRARVVAGTREDAVWLASSVNATHGLRRTNADKRRAVRMALEHARGATMSDAAIARHCRVHDRLVAAVRAEVEREQFGGIADDTAPARRVGADGRSYPARRQVREREPEDLTPRNQTCRESDYREKTHGKRTVVRDAEVPDDEPVIARDEPALEVDAEGEPEPDERHDDEVLVASARSRGAVAIALLAPRVTMLREQLGALAREAAALRGAITRAERGAPETVVPAAISSGWPLGRALDQVRLALDELEPHGACDRCAGAGCVRCSMTGWVSVREAAR